MAQAELEAALAEEPLDEAAEPMQQPAELESESGIELPEPADDSFIAPPAAEVQAQAAPQPAAQADYADPFAAAELANSGQRRVPVPTAGEADRAAPRKAQGLLAKVTGAARAFHEATQSNGQPEQAQGAPQSERQAPAPRQDAAPRQAAAARPPAGEARVKQGAAPSRSAAPAPSAAPQKPAAAKTEPGLNQPRLTGLDPAERVGVSQSEEDLLDIPAFLRRQAN